MAASRAQDRLRPPFWDRLVADPTAVTSAALRVDARQLIACVRRDIERLLNTRRTDLLDLSRLPEAAASLLGYGLPDLSIYSGRSSRDRRTICELIADLLRTFEPRLVPGTIRVDYVSGGQSVGLATASRAQFRIRAMLHVDPLRQPVTFDTAVDMETSEVKLEDAGDA
jgi:type VI secretion system protein ImpF